MKIDKDEIVVLLVGFLEQMIEEGYNNYPFIGRQLALAVHVIDILQEKSEGQEDGRQENH